MSFNYFSTIAGRRRSQYRREFGWWLGMKNWWAAYSQRSEASLFLPRYKTHFHLRPATSDLAVFETFFLRRPYDLPPRLTPGLIIDGGSNIGCATLFLARKYSGATILAVEPNPENARLCASNTSRFPRVRVIEGALWPRETWLRIEAPEADNHAFRVIETAEEGAGALRAITIPSLMKMAGAEKIDILKLDIEGAERELLADDADWISHVGILIIELHDRFRPGCAKALYRAIISRGLEFTQKIQGENIMIFFGAHAMPPIAD